MTWSALRAHDAEQWQNALSRFPKPDIYFTSEYHRAYEVLREGEAWAFVVDDAGERLFYPFFIRPIAHVGAKPVPEGYFDIETVYGYSGPLSTTSDPRFLQAAWARFSEWCRDRRIVAEFIRFHPLLGNERYMTADCHVGRDRETVAIDLRQSAEQLWANSPAVHRNMVRKAQANGLVFEETRPADGLVAFKELYLQTMTRVGAAGYYSFSDQYFSSLADTLQDRLRLFLVRSAEQPVAAGLFLLGTDQMHYHLSGSDERFQHLAPNNLLLYSAALWARERNFQWLHLGGGRTSDPKDGLFRFKASLSRNRFPFVTGKRVQIRSAYEELCAAWHAQSGRAERPNYFLLYRLGAPAA